MPIDRATIDGQLKEIGESEHWWEQREFRDLRHVLHEGERLRGLVQGKLLGRRRPRIRPAPWWLVVATDQRIVFLRHERFARKQVEIPNGEVLSLRQGSRLRAYQFVVQTPDRTFRLRVRKSDAFRFARAIAPIVSALVAREQGSLPAPGPGIAASLTDGRVPAAAHHLRPEQLSTLEMTVERLQEDVERLQQQVAFLENLLHTSSEEAFAQRMSARE